MFIDLIPRTRDGELVYDVIGKEYPPEQHAILEGLLTAISVNIGLTPSEITIGCLRGFACALSLQMASNGEMFIPFGTTAMEASDAHRLKVALTLHTLGNKIGDYLRMPTPLAVTLVWAARLPDETIASLTARLALIADAVELYHKAKERRASAENGN